MQRLYTIGIAVYNIREDYLRECLESVIANRSENIEILIVDDCSDEWCGEIIRSYLPRDGRIRYLRCDKNVGISAVRNKIIENARGEWILFVDGDDAVSDKLCRALPVIGESGCDIVVLGYVGFTDKSAALIHSCWNGARLYDIDEELRRKMALCAATRKPAEQLRIDGGELCELRCYSIWATAYRRDFLLRCGIRFNTSLTVAEDSVFNAYAYVAAEKAAFLPEITYYYRFNPMSVTNRYNGKMKDITDRYIAACRAFLDEKFRGSDTAKAYFWQYRCAGAVMDNFKRNIFHKNNPGSARQRRAEFDLLVNSEPYRQAIEKFDLQRCEIHKTRFVMRLAKKKRFRLLDFLYRHDFVFVLYGGLMRRLGSWWGR